MSWLTPSLVATLTGSLILVGVFAYLYVLERRRFLALWTVGWCFYALRFAFMLVYVKTWQAPILLSLNQTASLFSGLFLLLGAYEFSRDAPLPRKAWLGAAFVLGGWTFLSPLAGADLLLVSLPAFLALGAVFILTGAVLLRSIKIRCLERDMAGICFILWGLHKIDYPFLRPITWLAPWGYLLGAAFSFTAALSIILLYFRMSRLALTESESRFRIMLDNAQDALFLADQETARILDVNHLACASLGYTRQELLERTVPAVDPQVSTASWASLWGGRLPGYSASFPSEHRRKDGSTFPVEVNASVIEMHGRPLVLGLSRDVSARLEAENALRESERIHRIIFENSPLGMIYFNNEGVITRCNERFAELMGAPAGKLIGFNTATHSPHPDMRVAMKKALAGEEAFFEDEYVSAAAGKTVYLRVKFSPVEPGKKPTEVIATLEDVGEAKRADEVFQMYADIVRHMPSGLFIYQYEPPGELRLIDSNPEAMKHTGVSASDHRNEEYDGIWNYEDAARIKPIFLETVRTGKTYSGNHAFYDRGVLRGAYFLRAFALPGQRLGVAFEDIAAKMAAERALAESEAKYRLLFLEAIDPIILAAPDTGIIQDCNRAAETYFGKTKAELVGAHHSILHPGAPDASRMAETFRRHLETPGLSVEAPVLAAGGEERIAAIKANLVEFGGKTYLLGVFRDVTESRRYERALCSAKEQAEAASRAKNEFLATMSHEIRTPLNGVMGMLQLLQSTPLSAEQAEYVEISFSSSRNLLRLLSDILDVSKIEAGLLEFACEPFLLEDVVRPVFNALANQAADKGLKLVCDIAPDLRDPLLGDPLRIRQIFFNLLGNAVKYSDAGEIVFSAQRLPLGVKGPEFPALFTVSDMGIGIPEDKLSKVFESFTQADGSYTRKYGGAGLGLSIVRRLVHMMGGSLSVESEPGKGTVIYATLRLSGATAMPAHAAAPDLADIRREPGRVLVVEDESVNRFSLMRLLEKHGIPADEAANGLEAVNALERRNYACVLMDVQMPVMDGVEAARRIRAMAPPKAGTPIVALTAHAMPGDRERFLAAGMDGYLSKPVVKETLFATLERCMRFSPEDGAVSGGKPEETPGPTRSASFPGGDSCDVP